MVFLCIDIISSFLMWSSVKNGFFHRLPCNPCTATSASSNACEPCSAYIICTIENCCAWRCKHPALQMMGWNRAASREGDGASFEDTHTWNSSQEDFHRSSRCGASEINPTRNQEGWFDPCPRPGCWGSGIAVSCGVSCRCSSDPALLWLWCRPAATAPIQPLAWELPHASGAALKRKKKKAFVFWNCPLSIRDVYLFYHSLPCLLACDIIGVCRAFLLISK